MNDAMPSPAKSWAIEDGVVAVLHGHQAARGRQARKDRGVIIGLGAEQNDGVGRRLPIREPDERHLQRRTAGHHEPVGQSAGDLFRAAFDQRDIPAGAGKRPGQNHADAAGADDVNLSFHGPPQFLVVVEGMPSRAGKVCRQTMRFTNNPDKQSRLRQPWDTSCGRPATARVCPRIGNYSTPKDYSWITPCRRPPVKIRPVRR